MSEHLAATSPCREKLIEDSLTVADIVGELDRGRAVSTIKLNHGFWERCVQFRWRMADLGLKEPLNEAEWQSVLDRHAQNALVARVINWPVEPLMETLRFLSEAHRYPDVLPLVSPFGWAGAHEIEGTPFVGLDETLSVIAEYMSPEVTLHDGLLWKNAVQDGGIVGFLDGIRHAPTVVVGPDTTRGFASFCGFGDSTFIEVDARRASWHRHAIIEAIGEQVEKRGGEGVITLLGAGEMLSSWMVYTLQQRFPRSSFFVLGQVLALANRGYLRTLNWYAAHGEAIDATLGRLRPGTHHAADVDDTRPLEDSRLLEFISKTPGSVPGEQPVAFIENKSIDTGLFERILEHSRMRNHWANFGPVTGLLERVIAEILDLPSHRRVVTCKSATDALFALANLHRYRAARDLCWVVSAYGFFSTGLGPFADATIVDADRRGVLDIDALRSLAVDAWDGVVVTNPFGLAPSLEPIVSYARSLGKHVIVDNAAALFSPARERSGYPDEVVSFHHTKPWGIGEGGCVIVDEGDEQVFRSLINFGQGLDAFARRLAMNSKMSDFDAALILQRLATAPEWRKRHVMQHRRICSIAQPLGLHPLANLPAQVVPAHVPLVAPQAVPSPLLENPVLPLKKYYPPLKPGYPVAQSIFDRIVCVPCHPGIHACDTVAIGEVLARLSEERSGKA